MAKWAEGLAAAAVVVVERKYIQEEPSINSAIEAGRRNPVQTPGVIAF